MPAKIKTSPEISVSTAQHPHAFMLRLQSQSHEEPEKLHPFAREKTISKGQLQDDPNTELSDRDIKAAIIAKQRK